MSLPSPSLTHYYYPFYISVIKNLQGQEYQVLEIRFIMGIDSRKAAV
jgi:hypothetical protein